MMVPVAERRPSRGRGDRRDPARPAPAGPVPADGQPARRHFAARDRAPADEGHGVTPLELFFDLVFVFAITQVTASWPRIWAGAGALRGLVLLALLWWAWCSYAWLGNQAHADEGIVRVAMIVAMAAMFLVALADPRGLGGRGGGISAPVVLAVAIGLVRLRPPGRLRRGGGQRRRLRRQLLRTAIPVLPAVVLLVVGAVLGGSAQTVALGAGAA